MRILLVLFLVTFSVDVAAKCFDWELRRGHGNRVVRDANTVYINLPGIPKNISDFTVQARGILTPRIKNGECLDEKKRGNRARNFTTKLISRARKVRFCEPQWAGKGRQLAARLMVDGFDLAKVLVDKGFGRPSDSGTKSWCIR